MGSQIFEFLKMGLCFWVCFYSLNLVFVGSELVAEDMNIDGTVSIDANVIIGRIDDDFICAAMDWNMQLGSCFSSQSGIFFPFFFGCITFIGSVFYKSAFDMVSKLLI